MIISRRPDKRASIEKAPGPSKMRAADMTDKSRVVNALLCLIGSRDASNETPTVKKLSVATIPAIRVRKPNSSMTPARIEIDPRTPLHKPPPGVERRREMPWTIALELMANRRRRSPTPGQPSGKVENIFCSICLLGGKRAAFESSLGLLRWDPSIECFLVNTVG
jgi:hypothetical protein